MIYFKNALLSLVLMGMVPTSIQAQKNKEYNETSPDFFASPEA